MATYTLRLPFDPLHQWVAIDQRDPSCSVRLVARTCGIRENTMFAWRKRGVPIMAADELACRMGVHPIEIWGDEFFIGL